MWGGERDMVVHHQCSIDRGFTLIELMVVVAIVAILASIAYPSYQKYAQRTKRTDAQAEMLNIAKSMMQYKNSNSSFAGATVANVYGGTVTPQQGTALYRLTFNPSPAIATGLTLVATPIENTSQDGDGIICLNDQGQKYWAKGATACALSATSNWDGR